MLEVAQTCADILIIDIAQNIKQEIFQKITGYKSFGKQRSCDLVLLR